MFKKIVNSFEKKFKRSQRWAKLGQFLYLTIHGFNQSNLWESAYSCSFGFVFSMVPILLIIVSILTYVLQAYPAAQNFVQSFAEEIKSIYDITPFISGVVNLNLGGIKVVNVVLGVWIIWMARKMFLSIVYAMNRIFRHQSKRKGIFNQLVIFISEFVLIILVIVVLIASFIFNKFISLPIFEPLHRLAPVVFSSGSNIIVSSVIYFILFIFISLVYRFVPGTGPKLRNCILFGFLNTVAFFVLSFFLNKFYNTTNYNMIYGTISTVIVMMAKIYFFFVIFLYGAQMLYVTQFFDALLRSEVYLRPDSETRTVNDLMRKILFINPAAIMTEENTKILQPGDELFVKGDNPEFVYYVCSGIIREVSDDGEKMHSQGAFIGEIPCILNKKNQSTAAAVNESMVMIFSETEFLEFLHENPRAAEKALSKVSEYSAKLYAKED